MSDIVERLEHSIVLSNSPELLKEAVAEIKRLRAVSGQAIEGKPFLETKEDTKTVLVNTSHGPVDSPFNYGKVPSQYDALFSKDKS